MMQEQTTKKEGVLTDDSNDYDLQQNSFEQLKLLLLHEKIGQIIMTFLPTFYILTTISTLSKQHYNLIYNNPQVSRIIATKDFGIFLDLSQVFPQSVLNSPKKLFKILYSALPQHVLKVFKSLQPFLRHQNCQAKHEYGALCKPKKAAFLYKKI